MARNDQTDPVDLSVVVPVYRCAASLDELHRRVTDTIDQLGLSFELVLVDDRSPDDAWQTMQDLATRDPRVIAVRLSRNHGQHLAIAAGLATCRGCKVVIMDGDLEDPPEVIADLHRASLEGADIVYARARSRNPRRLRRWGSAAFFRATNRITGIEVDSSYGCFSLLDRRVVDAFLAVGDLDREYLRVLHWLGFETTAIDFDRGRRTHGTSSYTPAKLIRHAADALLFRPAILARWVVMAGLAALAAAAGIGTYSLAAAVTAWPQISTIVAVIAIQLTSTGIILGAVGFVGHTAVRAFDHAKGRPHYVISDVTSHNRADRAALHPVAEPPPPPRNADADAADDTATGEAQAS